VEGQVGDAGGTDLEVLPDAAPWTPPTWDEVVRDHSARVYRLAYRLTGNVPDAEDLTQEGFVRVFRSLSGYTPGTFEGWLHRITTNLFLDMARRRQRIRFEGLGDDAAGRLSGDEPTPAQAFDARHLDGDVQQALAALALAPELVITDFVVLKSCVYPQRNLVDGDARCASVAAASIVAKVTRDRLMRELDAEFPAYGFAKHKGYATPEHIAAIDRHGLCPLHRRSFVSAWRQQPLFTLESEA
jgi:RNA polymerase sigma factor (sigma-70 family)